MLEGLRQRSKREKCRVPLRHNQHLKIQLLQLGIHIVEKRMQLAGKAKGLEHAFTPSRNTKYILVLGKKNTPVLWTGI